MQYRLTILAAILAAGSLWMAFSRCNKVPPEGLRLPPEVTHAAYMGYSLSQEEIDALKTNFAGLEPTLRVMRERADAHILCYVPGQTKPKAFAVFLYEGLIFEGYDADSWLVQGKGGRAVVHKMNVETQILLEHYTKEAEEQAERRRLGGRI
jgi:hypothetical protein